MYLKKSITQFFYNMTINELHLMNNKFLSTDITYNSLLYLDIISYTPNCTASYLANVLNISKPAVTVKINELIKQGLIVKTQSEKDKRVYYLNINQEFAHIYEAYDKSMCRAIDDVKEEYTKEEIDTFCKVLNSISIKYLGDMKNEQ